MNTPNQRIAELSAGEKRLLLAELLRKKADAPKRFPLSFAQQRLWFLDQLVPGNAFYNISAALRLRTALSSAVLERSLNEIVRRHEALRTVFPTLEGQPVQQVCPELSVPLTLMDLRALPGTQREAEALRLATEEARRPFDLARGPLLRAGLLQLGAADYVFLLTLHHIVADGWSLGIFARELTALYAAFAAGRASPLAPLPIQYADFALWQRQWLQGEVLETQLSYWREQLKDLPVLQLPTDRRRPAVQTYRGAAHTLQLPKSLVGALKQLSQREGVTLFMTLLAAFKVLLHRYSGQDDIVTGVPVAGRNRAETEALIGFFVNTLVMRVDLSGDPTFCVLLARVRDVALGAYAHQDLPFEMLVEKLQPSRDLSRNPLFQVTFQLLNVPRTWGPDESALPGSLELTVDTAKFDLTFDLHEERDSTGETSVAGRIEYSTDLYDAATIERMSQIYRTLLESIVADPQQPLSKLALLSPAERHRLITQWNDTATDYPRDVGLGLLFEAQAQATPHAVAVDDGVRRLDYRELNARANQVARHLRSLGVLPGALVAVCMDRSADFIVALLGILKAGAAYVPLDPDYPQERLHFMLHDTRAALIITQDRIAGRFAEAGTRILSFDGSASEIARQQTDDPGDRESGGGQLAYVMYTSGSTGTPKGVCVPHRAIVRLVWNTNYVDFRADDVVAQASNASFDAATFEIWGALLHGARLAVVAKESMLSARELAVELQQRGITTLFLTTSLFNQLALEAPETFQGLRHLSFGGEAADPRCARAVLDTAPPKQLLNAYGPTETTTFACTYRLTALHESMTTIPIGRPISNSRVYLLDRHLEPVPIGIPGEVYIGGDGVARGYLHRPQLSAATFLPDPYDARPDAMMYRTGDLARYRDDGNIEYLGRIDQQVKLRGFRVEPGEIEALLCQHVGVQEAVVVVSTDALGARRLVAYIVARAGLAAGAAELKTYLRHKLPEYMVPSAFVALERLPLTPNGKLDRAALPSPDDGYRADDAPRIAPENDLERTIAAVWKQVLGTDNVGTQDNFFDVGGYSLLLVQVQSRLKEVLSREISITDLFRYPSIRSLAAFLDQDPDQAKGFGEVHERIRRRKEAMEQRERAARTRWPR